MHCLVAPVIIGYNYRLRSIVDTWEGSPWHCTSGDTAGDYPAYLRMKRDRKRGLRNRTGSKEADAVSDAGTSSPASLDHCAKRDNALTDNDQDNTNSTPLSGTMECPV